MSTITLYILYFRVQNLYLLSQDIRNSLYLEFLIFSFYSHWIVFNNTGRNNLIFTKYSLYLRQFIFWGLIEVKCLFQNYFIVSGRARIYIQVFLYSETSFFAVNVTMALFGCICLEANLQCICREIIFWRFK